MVSVEGPECEWHWWTAFTICCQTFGPVSDHELSKLLWHFYGNDAEYEKNKREEKNRRKTL